MKTINAKGDLYKSSDIEVLYTTHRNSSYVPNAELHEQTINSREAHAVDPGLSKLRDAYTTMVTTNRTKRISGEVE